MLPLFDEFGITNEIGATLEALKAHFEKHTKKKIPPHTTTKKHVESLTTLCFLPSNVKESDKWSKNRCVKSVLIRLNNLLYNEEDGDDNRDEDDREDGENDQKTWFKANASLGSDKISHRKGQRYSSIDDETVKISLNSCKTIKDQLLDLLLEDKLSTLRDYESDYLGRKSASSNLDSDSFLQNIDSLATNTTIGTPKTKTFKPNALLHHTIQFLEAATLLKSTNLHKKVHEELALQEPISSNKKNNETPKPRIHTYMWESTTATDVHCTDELTYECKGGVKLTVLTDRLKDYDGLVSCRHLASKQELYGSFYKSYERSFSNDTTSSKSQKTSRALISSRQMSIVSPSELIGKKSKDDLKSTRSHITFSAETSSDAVVTRFVRTPRNRTDETEISMNGLSSSSTASFCSFSKKDQHSDDLNTEYTRSASIYKGMVCNMLINHGKAYQTGLSDFARAWFLDFCCRCSCSNDSASNVSLDYTSVSDSYLNNLHEPTENDDFFCSELVYQTLMDIKLFQTLEETTTRLITVFDGRFDSTKSENLLRMTLSDFETPEDYYAFFTAYALLLLYEAGAIDYLSLLGLISSRIQKNTFKERQKGRSLNVTTCMITPSKLYDLDIKHAIGIPLEYPKNLYKLEESCEGRSW